MRAVFTALLVEPDPQTAAFAEPSNHVRRCGRCVPVRALRRPVAVSVLPIGGDAGDPSFHAVVAQPGGHEALDVSRREHEADVGVVDHASEPVEAAAVVRQRRGDGHHAGVQAAEEGPQEVDAVEIKQQDGTLTLDPVRKPCCDGPRVAVAIGVGDDLVDELAADLAQIPE